MTGWEKYGRKSCGLDTALTFVLQVWKPRNSSRPRIQIWHI